MNVVCYVTKYVYYVTLVNCMIVFRYLLYLFLNLFLKYVTHHTYSQYWDKLSISKVDFIEKLVIVLSVEKKLFLHCMLHQDCLVKIKKIWLILTYQYTGIGAQILAPQEIDIYLSLHWYFYHRLYFFLLTLSKLYFQVSKHTLSILKYEKYTATRDFI